MPSPEPVDEPNASESPDLYQSAKAFTVPVNPARLAWGRFDRGRNRDTGEGDIHASYSADTIATSGKIRKTFRWQAHLMVTVSLSGRGGSEQAEAYRLVPVQAFDGPTMSYAEKIGTAENADAARSDPNGFYHGMTVKQGQDVWVMAGPPALFVADKTPDRPQGGTDTEGEQLSLF